MPNSKYEQPLIDRFVAALKDADNEIRINEMHNCSCAGNADFADLEFTSVSGQRWAIEAKYGAPKNKANEVHKLFGDLLRETGRAHRNGCRIALLLYAGNEEYFRAGVRRINRGKYIQFGSLVPVESVFVVGDSPSFETRTWREFYDGVGNDH